jgi:hypothetical protein
MIHAGLYEAGILGIFSSNKNKKQYIHINDTFVSANEVYRQELIPCFDSCLQTVHIVQTNVHQCRLLPIKFNRSLR